MHRIKYAFSCHQFCMCGSTTLDYIPERYTFANSSARTTRVTRECLQSIVLVLVHVQVPPIHASTAIDRHIVLWKKTACSSHCSDLSSTQVGLRCYVKSSCPENHDVGLSSASFKTFISIQIGQIVLHFYSLHTEYR